MGKYTLTAGQNIFDAALHIYGSIEGITDLLVNNASLSMASKLEAGQELIYTDDFILDEDVVAYMRSNDLTPAGGERHVYPKCFTLPLMAELMIPNRKTSAAFTAAGRGTIEIDWGDNTPTESCALQAQARQYFHAFDSAVAGSRRIRLYGDAELGMLNLSAAAPSELYLHAPLAVEQFTLRDVTLYVGFLHLLRGTYYLDMQGLKCADLRPLVHCTELMNLDLRHSRMKGSQIDDYLLQLVRNYGTRRSARLLLPSAPGGLYREPARDAQGAYAPLCGMEALWVLTHEEAWNQAGAWKVIIDDKTYTYEPHN